MQITLDLPDSLTQTDTFNQDDWLREIAIATPNNFSVWKPTGDSNDPNSNRNTPEGITSFI
jgi:hypothetical protein